MRQGAEMGDLLTHFNGILYKLGRENWISIE